MAATAPATGTPWLVEYADRSATGTVRLLCFPYMGGTPDAFRATYARVPDTVRLYVCAYPGRGKRWGETNIDDIQEFVKQLTEALGTWLQDPHPFALFGYGMGATIAYELALHLQRTGKPKPKCLIVGAANSKLDVGVEPSLHLKEDRLEMLNEAAARGCFPGEILQHIELQELLGPIYRADAKLYYVSEDERKKNQELLAAGQLEKLDIPIFAYGGKEHKEVTEGQLGSWKELTSSQTFNTRMFKGDRYFLNMSTKDVAQSLNDDIKSC